MSNCELLLSGFADEAANDKTIDQQFAVCEALGMRYLTLRFIDAGNGVKNVIELDTPEIELILEKLDEHKLQISSIGSPIGKTKLLNVEDGTANCYFAFEDYLENQVVRACEIASQLNTKLVRGFSFYHPRGKPPGDYLDESAQRLAAIAQTCDSFGLTFGLEVEANLIGQNAELLMEIHRRVASEALVLIFDGANLVTQGYNESEVVEQYLAMQDAIGWLHIKDHLPLAKTPKHGFVDEDTLCNFVPAGQGAAGYSQILSILKTSGSDIATRMKDRGVAGIFADLEPHLSGGGQFGGFSGPDGFGTAKRAFCDLCEQCGITVR